MAFQIVINQSTDWIMSSSEKSVLILSPGW